jgi:tRNA A-37 threonylcarbamoyl transferase component Bud32
MSTDSAGGRNLSGTILKGEYEILEEIGQGAYGIVYRCREMSLGKIVAIKMLTAEVINEKVLDDFLAEGRKLAALDHPNVIQVHRAGAHEQRPYIVMEFVEGQTLRQSLSGPRLPMTKTLEIMAQVARGLNAIHATGVVHRDLSVNNIMVTADGTAKILDLGLARLADTGVTATHTERLAGTLHYIAPEVIGGSRAGFPADVFSFGVILYEMIAGRNPFAGEDPRSVLYNITSREPVPLASLVPDLPPQLLRIVDQCLQKNPEDRLTDLAGAAERITKCLHEISSALPVPASGDAPARRGGGSSPNPYHNRSMIRHPGEFVGRTQEVRRIYSRLNASPPGCIAVVGDRRIGKSSLLNYVCSPVNRDTFLERPDSMVMVFMDLQEHPGVTLEPFLRELMELIRREAKDQLGSADRPPTLDGMKDMIQELCRHGFRLAILLDEFEVVTTNENFSLEFFSFLRFLANQYDVGYITSSMRDLQVLCHTKEISDSPFFNIFSTMKLTAFSESEARELVTGPSARAGIPLEPYYDFITKKLAGYFPLFLQIACSHLLEHSQEVDAEPDLELVRRRFYDEVEPHYRFVWSTFDDHERSVIERVVEKKSVPESLQDVLVELEAKKYVVIEQNRARVFSSTFEHFLWSGTGRIRKEALWKRIFKGRRG